MSTQTESTSATNSILIRLKLDEFIIDGMKLEMPLYNVMQIMSEYKIPATIDHDRYENKYHVTYTLNQCEIGFVFGYSQLLYNINIKSPIIVKLNNKFYLTNSLQSTEQSIITELKTKYSNVVKDEGDSIIIQSENDSDELKSVLYGK